MSGGGESASRPLANRFPLEGDFSFRAELIDFPRNTVVSTVNWPPFGNLEGPFSLHGTGSIHHGKILYQPGDVLVWLENLRLGRASAGKPWLTFQPSRIQIARDGIFNPNEGVIEIFGYAGLVGGKHIPIHQKVYLPFPLGLDAAGKPICFEKDQEKVAREFPYFLALLQNPQKKIDYSFLLGLFLEVQAMQGQICPPDPDTQITLPSNPFAVFKGVSSDINLRLTGPVFLNGKAEDGTQVHPPLSMILGQKETNQVVIKTRALPIREGDQTVGVEVRIDSEVQLNLSSLKMGARELGPIKAALQVSTSDPVKILFSNGDPLISGALALTGSMVDSSGEKIPFKVDIEVKDILDDGNPVRLVRIPNFEVPLHLLVANKVRISSDKPLRGMLDLVFNRDGNYFGKKGQGLVTVEISKLHVTQKGKAPLSISGQLLLNFEVVNISSDPQIPLFRIRAGSLQGRLVSALVDTHFGKLASSQIELRDDPKARTITIVGHQNIFLDTATQKTGLGEKIKSMMGELTLGLLKGDEKFTLCLPPSAYGQTLKDENNTSYPVSYYQEPTQIDGMVGIQALLSATNQHMGRAVAALQAQFKVKGLQKPELERLNAQITLPDQPPMALDDKTTLALESGKILITGKKNYFRTILELPHLKLEHGLDHGYTLRVDVKPIPMAMGARLQSMVDLTFASKWGSFPFSHSQKAGFAAHVFLVNPMGQVEGEFEIENEVFLKVAGRFHAVKKTADLNVQITPMMAKTRVIRELKKNTGLPIGISEAVEFFNSSIKGFEGHIALDVSRPEDARLVVRAKMPELEMVSEVPNISGDKNIPSGRLSLKVRAGLVPDGAVAQREEEFETRTDVSQAEFIGLPVPSFSASSASDQVFVLTVDEQGMKLVVENPKLYVMQANTELGEDVQVDVAGLWRVKGFEMAWDAKKKVFTTTLDGGRFGLLVGGRLNLEGSVLNLDDLELETLFRKVVLTFNPATKDMELEVLPTPLPQDVLPPSDMRQWLAWDRIHGGENWLKYRLALKRHSHLAVLSERAATLPGVGLPYGKGKTFINATKTHFQVTVNEYRGNPREALQALILDFVKSLDSHREYPNPPAETGVDGESMIYAPGQDALFVVDRRDTKLVDRLVDALGISHDEAKSLINNGRIEMSYFKTVPFLKNNFPEEAIPALVRAFFCEQDPSFSYFTRHGHQALLALGDLRESFVALLSIHRAPWNSRVGVRENNFRKFDEPEYYRAANNGKGGFSMNGYGYLNFSADQVAALMREGSNFKKWIPWISESRNQDGKLTLTVFDEFNFKVQPSIYQENGVWVVSFGNEPNDSQSAGQMGGRFIIIPLKDGGCFVVSQHALSFNQKTLQEVLKGHGEDLTEAALKRAMPMLSDKNKEELSARMGKITVPDQDPYSVFPKLMNRLISNLNVALLQGELLDFRDVEPDVDSLTYTTGKARRTRKPDEYLTYDWEGKKIKINLGDDPERRQEIERLVQEALGIEEREAEEILNRAEISLEALAKKPFLASHFAPQTIENLVFFLLTEIPGVNDRFEFKGERFLYFLKDVREQFDSWANEDLVPELDIRVFDGDRFHTWGSFNTTEPGDGTDSVSMSIIRNVPFDEFVKTVGEPENVGKFDGNSIKDTQIDLMVDPKRPANKLVTQVLGEGLNLAYQLSTPRQPLYFGDVAVCPWTRSDDRSARGHGFFENEGIWLMSPVKTSQGEEAILLFRYGLLNTVVPNERQLKEKAFKGIPGFYQTLARGTLERMKVSASDIAVKVRPYSFGQLFEAR